MPLQPLISLTVRASEGEDNGQGGELEEDASRWSLSDGGTEGLGRRIVAQYPACVVGMGRALGVSTIISVVLKVEGNGVASVSLPG